LSVPPLKQIVEGALLAAGGPLTLDHLLGLFPDGERPSKDVLLDTLSSLERDYQDRGIELAQVAGGYRVQVRAETAPWVARLWEEKPARYSRALLETLALVAYRQPITRGEIEDIRGVAVSTNIVKTLTEREWIRVVGHRDVPGRPALYATTRKFLDYFGLRSLNELPTLAEIRDPEFLGDDLDLGEPEEPSNAFVEVQVVVAAGSEMGGVDAVEEGEVGDGVEDGCGGDGAVGKPEGARR
jgi:segregation and condensation protein B